MVKLDGVHRWRHAATVIPMLIGERSGGLGAGALVVERSRSARFMPRAHVFPGGAVDGADFDRDWLSVPFRKEHLNYVKGLAQCPRRPVLFGDYAHYEGRQHILPPDLAFRLAALRELFEETGILALSSKGQVRFLSSAANPANVPDGLVRLVAEGLGQLQKDVHQDPAVFRRFFASLPPSLDLAPATEALVEWSNWLTPPVFPEKFRFDTLFYLLRFARPTPASLCDAELESFAWKPLDELLHKQPQTNPFRLHPPQIYELARLHNGLAGLQGLKVDQVWQGLWEREQQGMERLCPQHLKTSDGAKVGVLQGDRLYLNPQDSDIEPEMQPVREVSETLDELNEAGGPLHRSSFRVSPENEDPWSDWRIHWQGLTSPTGHPSPALRTGPKA